jgi:hypothetical protein
MLETFYTTVASLCFALLGLWWVVVQFKHEQWMADPRKRRMAYDLSLYFILPGMMSLVSLLAGEVKILWRIGFSVAAIIGAFETLTMIVSARSSLHESTLTKFGRWVVVVLYVLIAIVAIDPSLATALGLGLKAIEVEGLLITLLLFLGVNFVWLFFAEPASEHS